MKQVRILNAPRMQPPEPVLMLEKGTFLIWLRAGKITDIDRNALTFYQCTNGDDKGFFGSASLRDRIRLGEVLIEQPERLLMLIADAYEVQSQPEKAAIVREALSNLSRNSVD